MIRALIAVSALASVLTVAAPASAEEIAVVSLAGKSPAQAYKDIVKAARTVCQSGAQNVYRIYAGVDCVKATVSETVAKVDSPALAQYVRQREQMLLTLAMN